MKTRIDGKVVADTINDGTRPVLRTHNISTMVYRLHHQHMRGELKFTKLVSRGDKIITDVHQQTTDSAGGSRGQSENNAGASIQVDLHAGTAGQIDHGDTVPYFSADSPNGDIVHEREAKK
jgi:hypothetical protein